MYGVDREPQRERRSGEPRGIMARLEGEVRPTPRASELEEAGPESNVDGGGTVRVESTRTEPGGPAVVEVPGELAEHTGDDSHLVVNGEGEAELVEVEPVAAVDDGTAGRHGAPAGSPSDSTENPDVRSIATPGEPGTFEPPLSPLPSTLLEVDEAVRVVNRTAWPEGSYVPYGNGKRAHWNGEGWRSGESPGYTEGNPGQ